MRMHSQVRLMTRGGRAQEAAAGKGEALASAGAPLGELHREVLATRAVRCLHVHAASGCRVGDAKHSCIILTALVAAPLCPCPCCVCARCLLFLAGYEGLRNIVGSAKPSKPAAVVQEDRIFSGSSTTSALR